MKKRSLFAAVAMLIVSALVMTSATYAWFTSSTTAKFTNFSATVQNTSGSLKIAAEENGDYTNTLTTTDITSSSQGDVVAEQLNPISVSWAEDAQHNLQLAHYATTLSAVTDSTTGAVTYKFTENDTIAVGTDWTEFTVWIKADQAGTVTVNPSFIRSQNFVYGMIADATGNYKLLGPASGTDSYYPLIANVPTAGVADNNSENTIIDSAENSTIVASQQMTTNAVNAQSLTISLAANTAVPLTVLMWAEGQDSNCNGYIAANSTAASMSLGFEFTATT